MEIAAPLMYVSGMSNKSDFAGAAAAGVPIGIQVKEASSTVIAQMAEYNGRGGRLFVDSGAFTAFRKGERINFDWVLDKYESMASVMSSPWDIAFVAPDVIGNMDETARLQRQYMGRLLDLAALGVEMMVPFQKGWPVAAYAEHEKAMRKYLGPFTVAFACNESAWAPRDIADVVAVIRPGRVHLLGAGKKMVLRYCRAIREVSRDTVVSADANRVRAFIGTGRYLTDSVNLAAKEAGDDTERFFARTYDETELLHDLYNTPGYLEPDEAVMLAKRIGITDREELARWASWSQEFADEDEESLYGCKLGHLLDDGGYCGLAVQLLVTVGDGEVMRDILTTGEVKRTRISARVEAISSLMRQDQKAIGVEFADASRQLAFDFLITEPMHQALAA